MLREMIKKIIEGENLTRDEAVKAMDAIMKGEASPAQMGAFLTGLRMKGETATEITGCATSMRLNARKVDLNEYAIDTCGTGGDGGKTFNISTASAIIASAAGVKVAKHGNKAISSKSGSADVLDALGIKTQMTPEMFVESIKKTNFGFLFAPNYHTSMKNVAMVRRDLGVRTIFNILGPISNPAGVKGQVLGVFDKNLAPKLAQVLLNLGTEKALVVHGLDGLDEVTTTTKTLVWEVGEGRLINYEIDPNDYGIPYSNPKDIQGGDAMYNGEVIKKILKGEKGPARDIVVLNTACALFVGRRVEDIKEGVKLANRLIDSGRAYEKLNQLREVGLNA